MIAKRSRIMVVDDDISIRTTLEVLVEDAGYEVTGADDGCGAIELAKSVASDLILLDINMPGINGVETLREIRKASPETIVVMMTSYATASLVEEALAVGAYTVLYKPLDVGQLMNTIQSALNTTAVQLVDDRTADV